MSAAIWKLGTQNAITTTLDGAITDSDETIALTSSTGFQAPGVITIDRLDANDVATPTTREYVSFTGISGNSLTGCSRGKGGSTAQAHSSGALVEENWSVTHWNDFLDAFDAEHSSVGVHEAALVTSLKATGAVVTTGTSDVTIVTPKALADAGISLTASSTNTLTNKRITKRVSTETSSATPTINTDNVDVHTITALATNITSMTTNLSGTPTNGQVLIVRIQDSGSGQTIAWGASFESAGATLPTSIAAGKKMYVGLIYNSADSKWDCVAVSQEA